MSEFIGSRISLVSRSDIRYVGTLHEINSETATVALENVTSFGTEGRKSNPDEDIPPSDSVYEYIVFRGSDVKDLRIEEAPAAKENKAPQMPNDPAILGTGSRPSQPQPQSQSQSQTVPPAKAQTPTPVPGPGQGPVPGLRQNQQQHGAAGSSGPPQYPQYPHYAPHFYPPPQWGRGGPVPGPGFPGMPYGAPPGWYPPAPGFPQGGPFPYGGFPSGPSGQQFPQQQKPAPIGAGANKQQSPGELSAEKPIETQSAAKPTGQVASAASNAAPAVAAETNSAVKETPNLAAQSGKSKITTMTGTKDTSSGPKSGRIVPAIPLQGSTAVKSNIDLVSTKETKAPAADSTAVANKAAISDATKAATAAVAAAMAKLPPITGQQSNGSGAVDNLAKKVKEMRTNEPIRAPRHPGAGGFGGHRGRGRGAYTHENSKIEVPTSDFDFESANAKFNKQDLVKEAIAGSPLGETPANGIEEGAENDVVVPRATSYNKASSFFDDLSSEIKDRTEGGDRPGGRVWRGEEQKKNLETFGQGSVDNGYRGGYRGRGRGRGGMRGRGYSGNGQPGIRGARGGHRGNRGESQAVAQ